MKFTIDEGLEAPLDLPGGRIKREEVMGMVQNYRDENKTEQKLFYAHFSLAEILDVFVDNKVLPPDLIKDINSQATQDFIKNFGFKIYIGKYGVKGPAPVEASYKGHLTTIVCNTNFSHKFHYVDKLNTKEAILIATAKKKNPGDPPYLDQANICPPEYAVDEPKCDYDVYYNC